MNNLLRFLLRYYLFILFVLLELGCFYLIFRNNDYQQVAFLNVANGLSGKVYSLYQNSTDYLYLRRYSDSLIAENAMLRARLLESRADNKIDSGTVSDSAKRFVQVYTYIPAKVVRNSVNQPSNLIYLDKGKLHHINRQMGVIAPNGIVGQVVNVTDNYAVVMSVLSKNFRVGVKFKKNEYFGDLHWEGLSPSTAVLEGIQKHVPVKVGDTVVTSGFSQLFPRNIMVGIVKTIDAQPEKNFLDITVKLSTDFGNLNYVYVVNNMRREELVVLDSLAQPLQK